ncbi:hypothetical protein ACFFIF_01785 [Vagococcus entomophilus]|uniref:Uncharacterized protein n=1 Tax=Vagococcus entomophilus TaxID=1160095 RepID=A0A430AK70_9ENTE|nr:hypothetical protein [Vagococcus entomophilus]RSU08468.1 hypothetical protein CBF30_04305 [Vagococcus entomophilus]
MSYTLTTDELGRSIFEDSQGMRLLIDRYKKNNEEYIWIGIDISKEENDRNFLHVLNESTDKTETWDFRKIQEELDAAFTVKAKDLPSLLKKIARIAGVEHESA